jgi:hypothetical protein
MGYCLGDSENLVLLMVNVMLGNKGTTLQLIIASPFTIVTAPILLLHDEEDEGERLKHTC